MEFSAVCRICLSSQVKKDISDLKPQQNDHITSSDIVLFCLSIQVNADSKISTKLCLKCWKRLIDFYDFKLLALKNDAHLKTLEACTLVKSEPFYDVQYLDEFFFDEGLKTENLSTCSNDFVADSSLSHELKLEEVHYDYEHTEGSTSDNEFKKSEIETITYEYIPEPISKTKGPKQAGTNTRKDIESGICSECGESVEDLKGHLRRHERQRDSNGRFPCPLCDKTFTTQRARKMHKNGVHLELREQCPICNKKVKYLKSHMSIHNTSRHHFKCSLCEKRYDKISKLKIHESTHSADRPHSCDLCDKKFQIQKHLMAHKRRIHEKQLKTALCHICSKTFNAASLLVKHMRIHTNERPYKCKECGKAFNSVSALRAHEDIHQEQLLFKCEVCDMKFVCKRYLKNHMLTHTREKRFSCHYCEWKFHRGDHVRQHEVAVHKIEKPAKSESDSRTKGSVST